MSDELEKVALAMFNGKVRQWPCSWTHPNADWHMLAIGIDSSECAQGRQHLLLPDRSRKTHKHQLRVCKNSTCFEDSVKPYKSQALNGSCAFGIPRQH